MLRRILVETRLYHRLTLDWVRRKSPALTVVYFEGTDTIGHVFAPFTPPQLPGIDSKDFQRYQDVPRRYFREVDGMLGDYRTLAEETGAALLIVSDHGFVARRAPARERHRRGDRRALASRRRTLRAVGQGHRACPRQGRGERRAGGGDDHGPAAASPGGGHRGPGPGWRRRGLAGAQLRAAFRTAHGRHRQRARRRCRRTPEGVGIRRKQRAVLPARWRGVGHPHGRVVLQRGRAAAWRRQGRRGQGRVRTGDRSRPEKRGRQVRLGLAAREGGALRGRRRPAASAPSPTAS